MNTKQWAVIFVALVSVDYTSAFFFGRYTGVPKKYDRDSEGYYGWSEGCRCNKKLTTHLDKTLSRIQGHFGNKERCPLKDQTLEEYEFNNGHLRGIHEFERRGPYRCSLSRNYVRVIFSIGFFRLIIHYSVSIVEDILRIFLGGIGSFIGKIFGEVTHFLFKIFLPDVFCTVVLHQRFGAQSGFELEGFYLNSIGDINFLNKGFAKHHKSLKPYFRPFCDHVLRSVFRDEFSGVFSSHFKNVRAEKQMFYYESESGERREYKESGSDTYEYDESDSYVERSEDSDD